MFDSISTRSTAVALALVVMLSMAGGAFAAAPTISTGSGDGTSTASDIQNGTVLEGFNASEDNTSRLEYIADSNNTKVEIMAPVDDGEAARNVTVYENSSAEQLTWNSTDGTGHFEVDLSHDELADVPRGINENKTVYAVVTNDTTADNPDTTTVEFHLNTTNEHSVAYIDDVAVDENDDITVADEDAREIAGISVPFTGADATEFEFERDVDGQNTDVMVVLGNGTVGDDFDGNFGELDAESWKSGFTSTSAAAFSEVDSTPFRTYASSIPDSLDSDATTVTYESVGGEDALVYSLGDEYEDADEVTISSDTDPGYLETLRAFGTLSNVPGLGLFAGGFGTLGLLFVFGKPMSFEPRDFGGD